MEEEEVVDLTGLGGITTRGETEAEVELDVLGICVTYVLEDITVPGVIVVLCFCMNDVELVCMELLDELVVGDFEVGFEESAELAEEGLVLDLTAVVVAVLSGCSLEDEDISAVFAGVG